MIKINITQKEHIKALNRTNNTLIKLNESGLKSRFNTAEFHNKYLGFLGEEIFNDWLLKHNIAFQRRVVLGEADDFDFMISNRTIDVKTNLRRYHMKSLKDNFRLLILVDQLKADYYFWVLVNSMNVQEARVAYLIGGLSQLKLSSFPIVESLVAGVVVRSFEVPLVDVIPSTDFIKMIE